MLALFNLRWFVFVRFGAEVGENQEACKDVPGGPKSSVSFGSGSPSFRF